MCKIYYVQFDEAYHTLKHTNDMGNRIVFRALYSLVGIVH